MLAERRPGTWRSWLVLAGATVAATLALTTVGAPTAALFASLLVGIAYALIARSRPLRVPDGGIALGQALIGVALGAELQPTTLRAVAADWLGVAVVTFGTLAASLAVGLLVARIGGVARATGTLGLVAGGASGIVAMADELGADARLVAFMQYLRVLVVVLVAPLLAFALLEGGGESQAAVGMGQPGLLGDLVFTALCGVAGVLVARRFQVTAGTLLCPLVIAAAIAASGVVGTPVVPSLLQSLAFLLIGWQVGLRFTAATIREAQRLVPTVLGAIAALIVACAGLALLLVPLADVTFADAYLATSPGGLYAVLAASVAIDANTTFVVSVQVLRIFVMILLAPPLVRIVSRTEPSARGESVPDVAEEVT